VGDEFQRIARLRELFARAHPEVLLGVGDDAAIPPGLPAEAARRNCSSLISKA
jgi:hypothetical protein